MNGIELIAAERQRQIEAEGWTPEHDDEHAMGELSAAAICYAAQSVDTEIRAVSTVTIEREWWPWAEYWWKPSTDPMRNLVKAGALIAAEIERLQRAAQPHHKEREEQGE